MGGLLSNPDNSDYSDDSSYSEDEENYSKNSPENMTKQENSNHPQREESSAPVNNICMDSATDAVNTGLPFPTMQITMSLHDVSVIEKQLNTDEIISLLYMLEDDPQVALNKLNSLLLNGQTQNLLRQWAQHQNLRSQQWEDKFVECLCIIQNYQVLKQFPFNREDLDTRFLPRRSFASECVNKVRKVLYFLCENLTQTEVQDMLPHIIKDFDSKGFKINIFDCSYLELYLLHWESVGYIKQNNLSNLCGILKQLEYFDLCEDLKRVVPEAKSNQVINNQRNNPCLIKNKSVDARMEINENQKKSNIFDDILGASSLVDIVSTKPSISVDNAIDSVAQKIKYNIDPNNPGVCLIINQEYFYQEPDKKYKDLLAQTKLDEREGTEKDKKDLETTFKMFGFKTEVIDNLTHTHMINKIKQVIDDVTDECSLFICIMSHGDKGAVYGVNSCRVEVNTIKKIMYNNNRSNLSGKPKILILQSCQGTRCQRISLSPEQDDYVTTDGPSSSKEEVAPPTADVFTFWATVPGYGAIRDKRTGSWFIQSLCDKMKNLGNNSHFEDICTAVVGDVSSKKWCQKTEDVAMVPQKDSTLRKLFYLPPIKANF